MTPLASAQAQVRDLQQCVVWLSQNLTRSTPRPWRTPSVSPDKRAEMDAAAKDERHERVEIAPGDSPDPYHFDIADALVDILVSADNLAELVALTVQRPVDPPASSAYADPSKALSLIGEHLDLAASVDDDVLLNVDHQFGRLIFRTHALLGHVMDGQRLPGICPWCEGKTAATPTGGERTLWIRLSEQGDPLVVCQSGRCYPREADCDQRWRGMPAWDLFTEGDWIARGIEAREQSRTCAVCGDLIIRTGRRRGAAVYCSEDCRRAADTQRKREERAA